MKPTKKQSRLSAHEVRQKMAYQALPEVRKLVAKYDLPAVQNAVNALYDERKASKELRDAELKVLSLKKKLGV